MKLNISLLVKITLGFIVSFIIAYLLKLPYFYTTGVITLLSLESTRLKSYKIALIRLISLLLSFIIGGSLFYLLKFEVYGVVLFILIFIPLSFLLKLEKGLSVSLVLVSQIYLGKDLLFTLNAFYIFIIGVGVALIFNIIMPNYYKKIKENTTKVDNEIDQIIQNISLSKNNDFIKIKTLLNETFILINNEIENMTNKEILKTLHYLEMRNDQASLLKSISLELLSIENIKEKEIILDFLKNFKNKIGEANYADHLNKELEELFLYFKNSPLPKERTIFEIRARLYTVLLEIKQFLNLKLLYHLKYQSSKVN